MYKNNKRQNYRGLNRDNNTKPVSPEFRMKDHKPTGRRKIVQAVAKPDGSWVGVPA